MLPSYGYSQRNVFPNVDLPQATGPVTPIICPGFAVNEISLYRKLDIAIKDIKIIILMKFLLER